MKFYMRDTDAALTGMRELTLEQIGAYNLILDLLYSRDDLVPDDDIAVARMISIHWRTWRALKKQLIAAGKIRVTSDGRLTANRVSEEILRASRISQDQRRRVAKRWQDYKKLKEINETAIQAGNTTTRQEKKKESNSWAVNSGDNSEPESDEHFGEVKTTQDVTPSWAPAWTSCELEAVVRAKGWTK